MSVRAHLSESAEQEEREDRDRLRTTTSKLRELLDRRRLLLSEVHRLSDEQKDLYDSRRPRDEEVERIHQEYREIGDLLSEGRRERDRARTRVEQALVALREFRATLPRGQPARPEEIRREMAEIEHRQQTTALPLSEENALIDRLRRLTRVLAEAEKEKGAQEAQHRTLIEHESALASARADVVKLGAELTRLRDERERRMASIRGRLADSGTIVAAIREKAKARDAVMERLRLLGGQISELEREADRLEANSRNRRQEARKVIVEYQRSVRGSGDGEAVRSKVADEKLDELLKRGRISLRG